MKIEVIGFVVGLEYNLMIKFMIFPNWGATSGNIINAQNTKSIGLVGKYTKTRKPTKKDWFIGMLYMLIPSVIIWILFILLMYIVN